MSDRVSARQLIGAWFDIQAKLMPFYALASIILGYTAKNYFWWG